MTNAKDAMLPMTFFNIRFPIKYEMNVKRAITKVIFSNIDEPYRDSKTKRSINNKIVKQPKTLPTITSFFIFFLRFLQSLLYLLKF
ncbi:hypothetical protein CW743_13775 [Staphylococcus shinii]|nr:hypothetical protein CW743_13775 [Staphylococcus shinii]